MMLKQHDPILDRYIAEVNRYPVLSREEEHVLATRYYESGDPDAARQLVVSNLRFVVKVAHEYKGYGLRLIDLIQEGNVGLLRAVTKFDPTKGFRVISYGVWWVRAYIQNFILRSWSLVKLGTTQAQRKLFFRLRGERDRALREIGAEGATPAALAKRLSVAEREVVDMDMRLSSRDFSLHAELREGARQTHMDMLPDESPDLEEAYARDERRHLVRSLVFGAMQHFNEKERYIVVHRLMSLQPQTLREIGSKFSISRERARQIEGNVLRKIRGALENQAPELAA